MSAARPEPGEGPGPRRALQELRERGLTLATAESLTGGLVAAALTEVPGSSDAYRGGVVCYATDLKATLAGVAPELLAEHGPVALETAAALAVGVARVCDADVGLSTTGVAGPTEQDGHPVGEVYVAVAVRTDEPEVRTLRLSGSRGQIRAATVEAAVALLLEVLETRYAPGR